jgi:hypothetical protein
MLYTSDFSLDAIRTDKKLLFLAGSIDLELPGNWRKSLADQLANHFDFFDPTVTDHKTLTTAEWEEHIHWELAAMEKADLILMNLLPSAKSPISLVELGLHSTGSKLIVVCPDSFYKKHYLTILCHRYSTPLFDTTKEAVEHVEKYFV